MIIEKLNDNSKKKMVGDLEVGQCFSYDDETTVNIKTAETDDHSTETLCVDLEDGTPFMATNSSMVIPVSAKVVVLI